MGNLASVKCSQAKSQFDGNMPTNGISRVFGVLCLAATAQCREHGSNMGLSNDRVGKLLSIFQVVRFPNNPCIGANNKNGTCYTSDECDQKGGATTGSCAQGFGVCCTFTVGCGQMSSENCTYFTSTGSEGGTCRVSICKCSSNICQLRLDLSTFSITGPSTDTTNIGKATAGTLTGEGVKMSTGTQCLTDVFQVTGATGTNPPPICGSASGEHMYVDADDACNELSFSLGTSAATGTTLVSNRQWNIKISQYECGYSNLAPSGCTQWFFGDDATGTVMTFNFDNGVHLANQNQNICVRRERGNCKICWTTAIDTDFQVSGKSNNMSGFVKGTLCCGYGQKGTKTEGYDCVQIPGAMKPDASAVVPQQICGGNKGLVSATGMTAVTICSSTTPFSVRFLSDAYETAAIAGMEEVKKSKGFKLTYYQSSC